MTEVIAPVAVSPEAHAILMQRIPLSMVGGYLENIEELLTDTPQEVKDAFEAFCDALVVYSESFPMICEAQETEE